MTLITTQTSVTPLPREPRRTSIRSRILLLTALPATVIACSWMYVTFEVQAKNDRALLVSGAAQTAKTFSERILDLEENLALTLEDQELISNAQVRAEEVIRNSALPITDVAVVNGEGRLVVAFAKSFPEGSAATQDQKTLLANWQKNDPQMYEAALKVSNELLENLYISEGGFTRDINVAGRSITLAATALPGGEGVTVTAIDGGYVRDQVIHNALRNLLILLSVLVLSLLVASRIAQRLSQRIVRLSAVAHAISENDMSQQVPLDGNDEITSLGESLDLLKESMVITLSHINEM